jgi:hypothetical protein
MGHAGNLRTIGIRAGLTAAVITAAGAVAPAAASVEGFYINSSGYSYRAWGMPDFDQVRATGPGAFGLPNSGLMYCVPTATLNLMAYIANHGFPNVMDPGPQNWQSSSIYSTVGVELLDIGGQMLTDPFDGTGGFDWRDGARSYLDFRSNAFTVSFYYANNNYAPTQAKLTHTAVCGSLVALAYGRYDVVGSWNGFPLVDRTGGHIVTLQRSLRTPNDRLLWVRDPADEQDNLFTQSAFTARSYGLLHDRFVVTAPTFGALKLMTEIGVDPGPVGSSNRYIDSYLAIRPKLGYALTDESTVITLQRAVVLSGFPDPPRLTFSPGGPIRDVVISPDMNSFLATTTDDAGISSLVMIDAATGVSTPLNEQLDLEDPERVVFGRNRALYLTDGRRLKCIDLDADPVEVESSIVPPTPLEAIVYDDARDVLVGVSAAGDALVEFDSMLADGSVFPLPDGVDLAPDASVAFNAAEGTLLIHPGAGANLLYQATPFPVRGEGYSFVSIGLQGVVEPRDIEVDDSGMFYVMDEDGAKAFARGEDGRFAPVADAPFAGVQSDGVFRVTKSRSNDREWPAEADINILPAELEQGGMIAECVWDLNGDGQVDAADLARMISGWGTVGAFGDIDGDGVGPSDLAGLISAWGVCP